MNGYSSAKVDLILRGQPYRRLNDLGIGMTDKGFYQQLSATQSVLI
jgi:hypothetical protein